VQVSDSVAADAAHLWRHLGSYSAVHLRLSDAGASTKGLNHSALLARLAALPPTLARAAGPPGAVPRRPQSVYIASNRPSQVAALLPLMRQALGAEFHVRCWSDVAPEVFSQPLTGLRAALVEHEVCVRAPVAFAGSTWSTWSNLIGLRRWAQRVPPARAYLDLATARPAPSCAEQALPALLRKPADVGRGGKGYVACAEWLTAVGVARAAEG